MGGTISTKDLGSPEGDTLQRKTSVNLANSSQVVNASGVGAINNKSSRSGVIGGTINASGGVLGRGSYFILFFFFKFRLS